MKEEVKQFLTKLNSETSQKLLNNFDKMSDFQVKFLYDIMNADDLQSQYDVINTYKTDIKRKIQTVKMLVQQAEKVYQDMKIHIEEEKEKGEADALLDKINNI